MSFLPEGYEPPKGSSLYMKFQDGVNKFRAVSNVLVGYEYWSRENKPVRLRQLPETRPADLRQDKDGKDAPIKHFWSFIVIDRADNTVKLLMITQSSVMNQINDLLTNEDWGDPKDYDLTVVRKGKDLETKYSTQPSPRKPLSKEEKELVEKSDLDLAKMIFGDRKEEPNEEVDQEVKIEDIPF